MRFYKLCAQHVFKANLAKATSMGREWPRMTMMIKMMVRRNPVTDYSCDLVTAFVGITHLPLHDRPLLERLFDRPPSIFLISSSNKLHRSFIPLILLNISVHRDRLNISVQKLLDVV